MGMKFINPLMKAMIKSNKQLREFNNTFNPYHTICTSTRACTTDKSDTNDKPNTVVKSDQTDTASTDTYNNADTSNITDSANTANAADTDNMADTTDTTATSDKIDKYDFEKNLNLILAQQNFASEFCKKLYEEILEFDANLDNENEVIARLVSFGETIQFSIEGIGFSDPSLIIFSGHTADGSHVQLVQHVNQISILLLSAKRPEPEKPKFPIGFRQIT